VADPSLGLLRPRGQLADRRPLGLLTEDGEHPFRLIGLRSAFSTSSLSGWVGMGMGRPRIDGPLPVTTSSLGRAPSAHAVAPRHRAPRRQREKVGTSGASIAGKLKIGCGVSPAIAPGDGLRRRAQWQSGISSTIQVRSPATWRPGAGCPTE
jgi:hypothetical protein